MTKKNYNNFNSLPFFPGQESVEQQSQRINACELNAGNISSGGAVGNGNVCVAAAHTCSHNENGNSGPGQAPWGAADAAKVEVAVEVEVRHVDGARDQEEKNNRLKISSVGQSGSGAVKTAARGRRGRRGR